MVLNEIQKALEEEYHHNQSEATTNSIPRIQPLVTRPVTGIEAFGPPPMQNQNDKYRLQLFPLSLTSMTFTWYSSLPPNLINSWAVMECCFHDTFYSPQQDILVANLMNTKQLADESITKFLE